MHKRRIMVTGGAGFIGSNFVRYWDNKYPEDLIIIVDKLTYAGKKENLEGYLNKPNIKFYHQDICDQLLMLQIMKDHDVDIVVHFAAESHVDRSIVSPGQFLKTNIEGTYSLLEAARTAWEAFDNKLFLHISTDEVYGSLDLKDQPFTTSSQYRPNNPYSASKAASDHLVRAYIMTYGLPAIITHCSNNYGPRQDEEKFIPTVIKNAIKGTPIPIYGDGMNIRDWLYVEDHCSALEVIIQSGMIGKVYNIGGNCEMTNIDLARLICRKVDGILEREEGSTEKLITFVNDRLGHDKRYATDNHEIKQLGWEPVTDIHTGLNKTIQWFYQKYNSS